MRRRALLGTLAAGCGTTLAGCLGSTIEGAVVSNETPLGFTHEHVTQGTFSGTRVVVDVTVANEGNEPVTASDPVPEIICTFLDGASNVLYESSLELPETLEADETVDLSFTLAVDTEELSRYTLRSEWSEIEEETASGE
jgi:hypothetical protein